MWGGASLRDRADLRARLKQPGGFAANHVDVAFLAGVGIVSIHELQHFALGDGIRRIGNDLHDRHAVEQHHHLKGARVQEISDENAGRIAEYFVGRLAASAQRGAVDHVIVQQSGGMDELDDGGRIDMLFALVPAGASRQKHQKRTQTLAAGVDDIGGHLVDERDLAVQTKLDDPVDGLEISGYQRANLF